MIAEAFLPACYADHMNAQTFQKIAEDVYAGLPARFKGAISNVVIFTEDFPDADAVERMRPASPYELLGLYQGWPLPERGSQYAGQPPDIIHLYRQPILAYCNERSEDVSCCIRHVLVHEIGHYFGFSDEEMEIIECQA